MKRKFGFLLAFVMIFSLSIMLYACNEEDISMYKLTISYVFENGESAANTYSSDLKVGENYSVKSPTINGYAPNEATIEGKMTDEDKNITVTYTANTYTLTIVFVDENNDAIDGISIAREYKYGEQYSITIPTDITGYELAGNEPETIEGTMGDTNLVRQIKLVAKEYDLVITYKKANNAYIVDMPETYTAKVKYGTTYSVNSPNLTGYTADNKVVEGTMGEGANIEVVYTINTYTITVKYEDEAHNKLADDVVRIYEYGSFCDITSPVILGYSAGENTFVSIDHVFEDVNKTVVFTTNPEMTIFRFISTDTTCVITGVRDTGSTIKTLYIPSYVTKFSSEVDLTAYADVESIYFGASTLDGMVAIFEGHSSEELSQLFLETDIYFYSDSAESIDETCAMAFKYWYNDNGVKKIWQAVIATVGENDVYEYKTSFKTLEEALAYDGDGSEFAIWLRTDVEIDTLSFNENVKDLFIGENKLTVVSLPTDETLKKLDTMKTMPICVLKNFDEYGEVVNYSVEQSYDFEQNPIDRLLDGYCVTVYDTGFMVVRGSITNGVSAQAQARLQSLDLYGKLYNKYSNNDVKTLANLVEDGKLDSVDDYYIKVATFEFDDTYERIEDLSKFCIEVKDEILVNLDTVSNLSIGNNAFVNANSIKLVDNGDGTYSLYISAVMAAMEFLNTDSITIYKKYETYDESDEPIQDGYAYYIGAPIAGMLDETISAQISNGSEKVNTLTQIDDEGLKFVYTNNREQDWNEFIMFEDDSIVETDFFLTRGRYTFSNKISYGLTGCDKAYDESIGLWMYLWRGDISYELEYSFMLLDIDGNTKGISKTYILINALTEGNIVDYGVIAQSEAALSALDLKNNVYNKASNGEIFDITENYDAIATKFGTAVQDVVSNNYYVEVARFTSAITTVEINGIEFTTSDTFKLSIGNNAFIKANCIKIVEEDGKYVLFVASVIVSFELANAKYMIIDGTYYIIPNFVNANLLSDVKVVNAINTTNAATAQAIEIKNSLTYDEDFDAYTYTRFATNYWTEYAMFDVTESLFEEEVGTMYDYYFITRKSTFDGLAYGLTSADIGYSAEDREQSVYGLGFYPSTDVDYQFILLCNVEHNSVSNVRIVGLSNIYTIYYATPTDD